MDIATQPQPHTATAAPAVDATPGLSSSATQQEIAYFNEVLPYALVEQARTGIPAEVMIIQSGNETGWGTSSWWRNHNNPAGIGVTGQAGAGQSFASPQAGWDAYANALMGLHEGGQGSFVADVQAGASSAKLIQDIEASPWAGGHYGWSPGHPVGALDQALAQMFGNQGKGADVGFKATDTSITGDVKGAVGDFLGGGVLGGILGSLGVVDIKTAILIGAQGLAGMAFITLGIIIILVDTKAVANVPIPVPV